MLSEFAKKRNVFFILVVSLLLLYILLDLSKSNQQFKRYVREDMKQSVTRLNKYFSNNRSKIISIIHNGKMDYNQLENLKQQHSTISKEIFNLHLKSNMKEGRTQEEIETIYIRFNYGEGVNDEDIRLFFEGLNKEIGEEKNIKLEDKDINKMESILEFYSEIDEKVSKIN